MQFSFTTAVLPVPSARIANSSVMPEIMTHYRPFTSLQISAASRTCAFAGQTTLNTINMNKVSVSNGKGIYEVGVAS